VTGGELGPIRIRLSSWKVIMDEVGRGTTMKDGLAISFSTLHHLHSVNRCRALFATHFHELADMVGYSEDGEAQSALPDVSFFCTDVDETAVRSLVRPSVVPELKELRQDGLISYSHRLRPGVNRDSHGLKVARLAGMPPPAMDVAEEALLQLRNVGEGSLPSQDRLRAIGRALSTPPLPS
jgi:DNA mismatch repair ATPase MutS